MIWDSSSLPSGPPAPPIVDGPRLIHKWSFVGVENDLEQQALTDDTAASFIDAGRNNRDEDSSNSASDDDDGPDLGEIASWERPSRRPSIAFKSKRKADHTASIDKSPRDSKAGQPPVLPIFNRLPPLREQLSNFLFPEADLPPLPRPLDPKPVMLERRRSHRRRTSDMSDYWSEFQLSKSQYFPTALEKVVADEHVPRIIYFFRTFSILAIMLATSGFYAAVSSIPIKAPYETAGSVKGSLYALAHVFLMSTGMGYYGAFALCTAIGLRATFTHFWRVHTPAIIYGVCCSAICWATIVQGSWPLPFQTFLYMFIFTPVVSTLVYISIPKVDRKPPGTIKLFCKRALVFCMMPMLFYICSALFMWAITVNLANPFRQVASLCAYRLCTILFVAACQHYANTVTKRRNPEVGSLMKLVIMYVQEVFVRLATPSLGTVWVFVCSLLLEAANMSLPLLATHTFANKHIQALNNLCTRLVTTASNDVRRLYARTARSRFRSLRRISRRKIDPGLGTNSTIIAASMDIKGSISGSNAGSVAGSKETTQQETMSEAAMALDVVVPMDLSSPIMSDPLLCEAVKTYFFAFLAKMASFITFAVSYPVFIGGPNAEWYHVPGEIENSPTKTWTYLGIHVIPVLLHCVFSTIYLQRQCKFDMFEYGLALLYYYIEFFIGIAFIAPAFPHTMLGWHWNVLSYFQTHGVSAVL